MLAAELLASLHEAGNELQSARAAEGARRTTGEARGEEWRVELEFASEWPKGFFEDVVGGWQGEPLDRPEQGHAERRDRL